MEALIWHQWEERHLVLWRLAAPEKGDARGMRWDSVGGLGEHPLRHKGERFWGGVVEEGRPGRE